jgi:hypothetical protein
MSLADSIAGKRDNPLYSIEKEVVVSPGSVHALRIPQDCAF